MASNKISPNQTMLLNRAGIAGVATRGGKSAEPRGPRMLRISVLILLALSPFLAYVLFLPSDEVSSPRLEANPQPTSQASPSPLFTSPPPFLAVPDVPDEPLPDDQGARPERRTTTSGKKPAPQPKAAAPPPAPVETEEPPPSDQADPAPQEPPQEEPPPPAPSGDGDCWPVCGDPAAADGNESNRESNSDPSEDLDN